MHGATRNGKAQSAGSSVLLRHVVTAARRAGTEVSGAPEPVPRTPERIVANAIGRAGERVHELPLFFDRVECTRAGLAELMELLPERALISVVEGPASALGVVAICPGLLSSVIEMQATGRISARPVAARRPTRADGLICADFINACLTELGDDLSPLPGCEGLRGYRYTSFLDDARPLELMLDQAMFHLFTARLRAGSAGQRDGIIVFALPVAGASTVSGPAIEAAASAIPAASSGVAGSGSLAEVVRATPIDLVGVLCRRTISLGELRALAPGQTIALPLGVLGAATIETTGGQVLFRGKLGELAGRHALRLAAENETSGLPSAKGKGEMPVPISTGLDTSQEPPMGDLDAPDLFRSPVHSVPHSSADDRNAAGEDAAADSRLQHAGEGAQSSLFGRTECAAG